jgi:hypothetical protein
MIGGYENFNNWRLRQSIVASHSATGKHLPAKFRLEDASGGTIKKNPAIAGLFFPLSIKKLA